LLKVYGSAVFAATLAPGRAPVREGGKEREKVKERRQCVLHSVHLNVSKATVRTANVMSVV
jgi:hypothetical protein